MNMVHFGFRWKIPYRPPMDGSPLGALSTYTNTLINVFREVTNGQTYLFPSTFIKMYPYIKTRNIEKKKIFRNWLLSHKLIIMVWKGLNFAMFCTWWLHVEQLSCQHMSKVSRHFKWCRIKFQFRLYKRIPAKGPYPPCLQMADRAFLAGYPRYSSSMEYPAVPRYSLAYFQVPLQRALMIPSFHSFVSKQ